MNRCEVCGVLREDVPEVCPACGGYQTVLPLEAAAAAEPEPPPAAAIRGDEIPPDNARPVPTTWKAWDTALGGGFFPGSSLVFFGDAGGRKTTWAGALATRHASRRRGVGLYLCAEMPTDMVRDAVKRLTSADRLYIVGIERDGANLAVGLAEIERLKPKIVVYDSIQTFEAGGAMPRSEIAISTVVRSARRAAAMRDHVAILISQVNKAGAPMGPQATIHACDVILHLGPDKLTVHKNRFRLGPREVRLDD